MYYKMEAKYEYDYSVFQNGVFRNPLKLKNTVDNNFNILGTTCIGVVDRNIEVDIYMGEQLTAPAISALSDIVTSHDTTFYQKPLVVIQTINDDETITFSHYFDYENERRYRIVEVDSENNVDTTFTYNQSLSSDYTISNASADLYENSFSLVGTPGTLGPNIAPNATAVASSQTLPPSNANDNNTTTFWYNSSNNSDNSWWYADFGSSVGIFAAEVLNYSSTYYVRELGLEWSNNGTDWTEIVRGTNMTYTESGQPVGVHRLPQFSEPVYARYFRFFCHQANNSTYNVAREYRLFQVGNSIYTTNTPSTISNINTQRQIDTDNWDNIISCEFIGDVPTDTTAKIILSFDNQSTWVYWDGSQWASTSLANIETLSMTKTTFENLTSQNFSESGGLNSGTRTIDAAISIATSDQTKTSFVQQLNFNYKRIPFEEEVTFGSTVRVRNVGANQTEIKNISGSNKTFKITIS